MRRCPLLLIVLVLTTACSTGGNRWRDPAAGDATPTSRAVVFAPVAAGSVRTSWPEASLALAHRMALDIDLRVRDADGLVGEDLPDAADPSWNGRRAGAAAAHLVVLGRITTLSERPVSPADRGITRRFQAQAELVGIDAAGTVVFRKTASGEGTDEGAAKQMGPESRPESRAAWDALGNTLPALRTFLEHQQDAPAPAAIAGIAVPVASFPAQADILVDGRFVGTTPQTLTLPARAVTLRLERAGYRAWERTITPAAGMTVNPALEKNP